MYRKCLKNINNLNITVSIIFVVCYDIKMRVACHTDR